MLLRPPTFLGPDVVEAGKIWASQSRGDGRGGDDSKKASFFSILPLMSYLEFQKLIPLSLNFSGHSVNMETTQEEELTN